MNTLNSVYETINKISDKTELAKHEVKLNLIEDFNALILKGEKITINNFSVRRKGKDVIQSSIIEEKLAIESYSKGLQISKTILTQMKELGLTDPKVNERTRLFELYIKFGKERINKIEKALVTFM